MAQPSPSHLRSLYRAFLRELPSRPLSSGPSPLQQRIRSTFVSSAIPTNTTASTSPDADNARISREVAEAEQFIGYLRAQRMYATLLERYNPGIIGDVDVEEQIRKTARRVGMVVPD